MSWRAGWQPVTAGEHRALVWRETTDAPVAEWYWLSPGENPDDTGNTMPETALAALLAKTMEPAEVFPPSEFLRDEMTERGWSQADLADHTGRDRPFISRVLSGAYPIGPRFALDLERATGISAEMWCRLQADYAVWIERQRHMKGERHGRT